MGCLLCWNRGAVDLFQRWELLGLSDSAAGFCAVLGCLHGVRFSFLRRGPCGALGVRARNKRIANFRGLYEVTPEIKNLYKLNGYVVFGPGMRN